MMNKYSEVSEGDLTYEQRYVWDYIQENVFQKIDGEYWVAGGILRKLFNTEDHLFSDIDMFFRDKDQFEKVKTYCLSKANTPARENENAVNFAIGNLSFDLIKKFFPAPQATIMDFDFTVCCCVVNRESMCYHDRYFQDLESREIYINHLNRDKIDNLLPRLQKYILKGYRANNDTLRSIATFIGNNRSYIDSKVATTGSSGPVLNTNTMTIPVNYQILRNGEIQTMIDAWAESVISNNAKILADSEPF